MRKITILMNLDDIKRVLAASTFIFSTSLDIFAGIHKHGSINEGFQSTQLFLPLSVRRGNKKMARQHFSINNNSISGSITALPDASFQGDGR